VKNALAAFEGRAAARPESGERDVDKRSTIKRGRAASGGMGVSTFNIL